MGKYDDIIKQYRMIYDHHTHTIYSHGKGTILDNVRVAAAKGIRSIAITDHGPGHLTYGIKMEQIPQMRADIAAAKAEFPEMEICWAWRRIHCACRLIWTWRRSSATV